MTPLDVASLIGDRLAGEAIWSGDRCTWLSTLGSDGTPSYGSVGTSLYDGLCGIALFLGELGSRTGDRAHLRSCRGALETVWARRSRDTEQAFAAAGRGFFAGVGGTAWCFLRLGSLLGDERLSMRGRRLAEGLPALPPGRSLDVIAGNAGMIGPLSEIASWTGDDRYGELAREWVDEIVSAATRQGEEWSWPGEIPSRRPLTGLAHGAAGYGLALEYGRRMFGGERYAAGAQGAIAYEDAAFSASLGNWHDFRVDDGAEAEPPPAWGFTVPKAQVAWCHGAGGIALARSECKDARGVERAVAAVEAHLGNANASHGLGLCHGASGLVEILLTVSRSGYQHLLSVDPRGLLVRRWRALEDGSLAALTVSARVEGVGLMDGVAGVGYEALRLTDPVATPPVLCLAPR
jgi:lantibiotic modifying enzyme